MDSAAETQFKNAFQILDAVFLALGLASNLFVCFIMTRCSLARKSISNFYILQLSVTEVVYRTVLAALKIYTVNGKRHLISDTECKILILWPEAMCAAIFILLAGIAMDRKKHIINPLKAMAMDKHRKTRIVFIWLFALTISIPTSLTASVNPRLQLQNSTEELLLLCLLPRGQLLSKISFTIYSLFGFVVPLAIILRSYYQIYIYLRERAKTRKLNASYIRSKYRALRMMVHIILSFLLSWGPVMCSTLATVYGATVRIGDISVKHITICISLTSSIINPVIYSFGNVNFRSEVVRTFRSFILKVRWQRDLR
ncbi:neuropeptide FF receptor 2-like [Stylophora pistillata]|uniref:neuropeptide FF receptor 2-like n=1 Tax=Stylophora pistillata TaxID=50429 RepID=UPI000C03EAE9|nr:neuropeptide FF receptor 2-like [Stylophora pistillata]